MKFKAGTDPVAFRSIGVIATDYDRTLTDLDMTLHRETIGAIDDASEAGLSIIIVSGRGVRFMMNLKSRFRQIDALVAENGAVVICNGSVERIHEQAGEKIAAHLLERHVPFVKGQVISYIQKGYLGEAEKAVAEMGGIAKLVRNIESGMVLPSGVDKDVGLLSALEKLGRSASETAIVGDGENDFSMFDGPFFKVALKNSVAQLQEKASAITEGVGGEGVRELLKAILAARENR